MLDLEDKIIFSLLCITSGISNKTNCSVKSPPIALCKGTVANLPYNLGKGTQTYVSLKISTAFQEKQYFMNFA